MISTRFCPICGAANLLTGTHCFACGHSLDEKTQEETLLHARYRLGSTLGTGGFSAVYHAHDLQTDREVAIKRVTLSGLSAEETIEATDTFNRERDLLSTLRHHQVPRLYDHFHDRDHWYLVLEYLEGATLGTYLETRLSQGKPLQFEEILTVGLQLCAVLEYLHTRQPPVIFRDLKPGNIIRSSRGKLSLIDFGIARYFRKGQARDTRPLGSPGYASPEQYGRAQTTPQSDLYSLGVLLYALLSGQDPAEEPCYTGLAPLSLDNSPGGYQLSELVRRLIAPFPDRRPTSASEVANELEAIRWQFQVADTTRLWHPPELPQTVVSDADHQRQIQIVQTQFQAQVQARKNAGRRRFLRRGLIGGAALVGGGSVFGYLLSNLSNNGFPGQILSSPPSFRQSFRGKPVSLISWAPDGSQAVMVSSDSSILIYRIGRGAAHSFYLNHTRSDATALSALAWAPDSRYIAFGSIYGSIILWDTRSDSAAFAYDGTDSQMEAIAWSPNGTLIASASGQGTVQIFQVREKKLVASFSGSNSRGPRVLAWSPDSTRIVVENEGPFSQGSVPALQVWDSGTGMQFTFASVRMLAAAWSPDGTQIVSVDPEGTIYFWQAADGKSIATYPASYRAYMSQSVMGLVWSPDSTFIALDFGLNWLQVLNVRTHTFRQIAIDLNKRRTMIWLPGRQIALIDEKQKTQFVEVQDWW